MEIRGAGEALYIACQMEKRAIRLYERALAVFTDGACQDAVRSILAEERNHLDQFSRMGAETPDFERAQLLSAKAAEVLFSGGLVEAQRKGAEKNVRTDLVLDAIAKAENIQVNMADVDAQLQSIADQNGARVEDVKTIIRKNNNMGLLLANILRHKAAHVILDNAK